MIALLAFGLAVYVWCIYAPAFSGFLAKHAPAAYAVALQQYGPLIFAGLLLLLVCGIASIAQGFQAKKWSDAVWETGFGRRVIGLTAGSALFLTMTAAFGIVIDALTGSAIFSAVVAAGFAVPLRRRAKIFLGRSTKPLRWFLGSRHTGIGGSARFSGLLDEWSYPWAPGQILLGRSKYDPRWLVGITDDRHLCTIATSRAGKGRSQIVPNLLTWPGSAIIIDPKGQNACISALKRGPGGEGVTSGMGQTIRILDPLEEIADPEVKKLVARFNPLEALDPKAKDYVERVRSIADALVLTGGDNKDAFFDSAAKTLIAGCIDFVRRSETVGDDERNLATVRGLLVHPDGPPIDDMTALGGLAQSGAAGIRSGGDNSTKDVIFTAMTHTDWLDSAGMQHALSESDFSLKDLSDGNTTIYLVLPPHHLDEHARFLRLFINLTLKAASEGRKGKHATLFLLDEFYSLGSLQLLAKAAGLLAGFGIKLWPVIQNLSQLKELYPRNWSSFLGNAGIWTVFAMNDDETSDYLSKRLGRRILWRKMRGPDGFEWEIAGGAALRDPLELSRDTSRASNTVAVFTESGEAFLLGRVNYDTLFAATEFSADPLEQGESA